MLCILLICQQQVVAQSYNLGRHKQSFEYETLYANQPKVSEVIKSNNEIVKTQSTKEIAGGIEDLKDDKQIHKKIVKMYCYGGIVFKKYNDIYESLSHNQENLVNLQKIQLVVLAYFKSQKTEYPHLEQQLKNTSSMEEEIQIFLSYYKE